MTLINRFRHFFSRSLPPSIQATQPTVLQSPSTALDRPLFQQLETAFSAPAIPTIPTPSNPLPDWLADEEDLRDEGVFFGLSEARPDGKIAQIRAYFSQQAAPFDALIEQYTEKISELNLFIEQRENRLTALRDQVSDLLAKQTLPNNLIRTILSLVLSAILCIGNFFLIDDTLRPIYPNHWIAVGVFMAGMFNLFGRTSFFFETGSKLTGRRLVEEGGLPMAAALFVFVQALQSQSTIQSIGLFIFVFFLFLLAGKLVLSTLTQLQTDRLAIRQNNQLIADRARQIPIWETEIDRLTQEIDAIRMQKWPIVTALNHAEANRARLNTQRDGFVHLFVSEFELARSLRDRLTEQQRQLLMSRP